MTGRTLFIGLGVFVLIFGVGLYYALNYAYYQSGDFDQIVLETDGIDLTLRNVQTLDGDSSPIKFRLCADPVVLDDFPPAPGATPLVAPKWFGCFDAGRLQSALDRGEVDAHLIRSNTPFGVDLVGMVYDNQSFFWRQLSDCGEARFSGDPMPEHCPEIPN